MFLRIRPAAGVALMGLLLSTHQAEAQPVTIRTYPAQPIIARDLHQQHLQFDFGLENTTDTSREITRIELVAFDAAGRMIRRQFIAATGAASPGLLMFPERTIAAKARLSLFNPFHQLPVDEPVHRLHYTFIFGLAGLTPTDSATIDVLPIHYRQTIRLVPPVDGPTVVYDGHDIYSHHRRIPMGGELARRIGLDSNPVRYANDFSPVGPNGDLAHGPIDVPANWYAYGATVRAPGDGVVVSAVNDVAENRIDAGKLIMAPDSGTNETRQVQGNHVIIRHPNGLFSTMAHLKAGSVRVRAGDQVVAGEPIGQIGFSGDTGHHVHLHHMVTAAASFNTDGFPIYYDGVRRVRLPIGGRLGPVLHQVRLDTGDLFQAVR